MIKKIGFDLVEIARFKKMIPGRTNPFFKKVFTDSELDYCFSYKNPEAHLAGLFAAKEAVSKALGVLKYPFAEIEIRHAKDGMPLAYKNNRRLKIALSITHTDSIAGAIAVT